MTAAPLLSSVLPDDPVNLAAVELYSDPPGLAPLPDEEPLIAKSVAKRRNEFVTVRHCARLALQELGQQPVPILKGDKGEPRWPDGIVGSLTHTQGFRGAVVARQAAVRSVGIDAEPHDVLPDGVLDAIAIAQERAEMTTLPHGLHWDRILFCAKEATYKAWFPLTRRWLGFEDAHVVFDTDPLGDDAGRAAARGGVGQSDPPGDDAGRAAARGGVGQSDPPGDDAGRAAARGGVGQSDLGVQTSGQFVSKILVDGATLSGPALSALRGRWSVQRGLVLTAIVL